jgi:hypothetical protein
VFNNMSSRGRALLSIFVIIAVAGWLFYYYNPWSKKMPERTQDEKQYTYKCGQNHLFTAFGKKSPRPCQVEGCNQEAYRFHLFACTRGDKIGIIVRTSPSGDEYKFDNPSWINDWRPFNVDEIAKETCPNCRARGLLPAMESPSMEK